MSKKKLSAIPDIPVGVDAKLRPFLAALKEAIEVRLGRRGDPLEEAVTKRELKDAQIVNINVNGLVVGPGSAVSGGGEYLGFDYTPDSAGPGKAIGDLDDLPTTPGNFTVEGVFGGIILSWDLPRFEYRGHAYTEVWRAMRDDPTERVMIATATGSIYSDAMALEGELTYWYWIRHVSVGGVYGPFSDARPGTKPEDVGVLIERLTGEITSSVLAKDLSSRIDLIDADASVAGSLANVAARIEDEFGTLLEAEQTARAAADSALASQITTLQTSVNGNTAAIQTQATVVNGLSAQYMVKTDVNGYVSGFGLYNAGGTSQFLVNADRFAVGRPGVTSRLPFIVSGSNVFMDTAVIADASIQRAKIGSVHFNALQTTGGVSVLVGGKLKADYIEADNIVTGYLNANTGFITTGHIKDLAVDTLKIKGNAVTMPYSSAGSIYPISTGVSRVWTSGYVFYPQPTTVVVMFSGRFLKIWGQAKGLSLTLRVIGSASRVIDSTNTEKMQDFEGIVLGGTVTLPAGSYQFALDAGVKTGDTGYICEYTMFALGTMR